MIMDYCTYALECMLKDQKVQQLMEVNHLVEESNFIIECINTGYITLENMPMVPVTEGLIDSIIEFFNRIIAHFKRKAVERSKKYIPWLKDNRDAIKQRAAKTEPLKLSPLWEGDWDKDADRIRDAIRMGFDNYANKKYTNYSFTSNLISKPNILTDDGTGDLTDALKQYFRYNIKTTESVDDVTVSGAKLSELIDQMLDYLINFDTTVVKNVTQMNEQIVKALKNIKTPEGEAIVNKDTKANAEPPVESKGETNKQETSNETTAKESFSSDLWLSIEQRPVCESMLRYLVNYDILTEADDKKPEAPNAVEKSGDVQKVETASDNKSGHTTDTKESDTNNEEATTYLENVKKFARFAVSAYQTVLVDRYILYLNICKKIGDASGKGPRFDRNGKYIPNKAPDNSTTQVK